MAPCFGCADPAPALAGRSRASVATMVKASSARRVGVRELRALLTRPPRREGSIVIFARGGFTEGALALASSLSNVVLCVP